MKDGLEIHSFPVLNTRGRDRIESFIKSRKMQNKEVSRKIIKFLEHNRTKDIKEGWVRSSDLKKVAKTRNPNLNKDIEIPDSTFFKIIKDLIDEEIIVKETREDERVGRGKDPVFYRLLIEIRDIDLLNRNELRERIFQNFGASLAFIIELQATREFILESCKNRGKNGHKILKEIHEKALANWNQGLKDQFGLWEDQRIKL